MRMYDYIDHQYREHHGMPPVSHMYRDSHIFTVGIEYEIEDVKGWNEEALLDRKVRVTNDGSLRNNGKEFITAPEPKIGCLLTFNKMFSTLGLGPNPFTDRTSTHVHMNVACMDPNNFLTLVYAYAALEPVFFNFAGQVRQHNIHCVPLSDTYLSRYYTLKGDAVSKLLERWSKYTAFNILPAKTQGSVEFRHMYGTKDPKVFQEWLEMIESLYTYAYNNDVYKLKLFFEQGGTGKQLEEQIFKKVCPLTEKDLKLSVMEAKLAFI